jgi:HAE1 family hydrophobic/amphiphilic exporter-1
VKNDRDEMVPYSALKLEKVYGLSEITRHNMYTSTEISGSAAAVGYSSGTAIKVIQEVAAENYQGYDIDWAGISADEVSRNQAIWVFLICLGFVYLVLAAQYESFILPIRNSIITNIWCFSFC